MFNYEFMGVDPVANEKAVIKGDKYRLTVLTERLIRMEWSEDGTFEDRPTKAVICRNLPVPKFTVTESESLLEIDTEYLHLYYDKQKFSSGGLSILLKGMVKHKCYKWFYGMEQPWLLGKSTNLKGTVCTLDMVDGETELEDGVLDRHGFAILDDSKTQILNTDGWFENSGRENSLDLYFFGYSLDHKACIRDFYKISGSTPMVPRYALGNWWSRYYKYTEETYLDLMNKFAEKEIPLAVSVLDIDWHPVLDVDPKYGNGWTGYTWNRNFFPDPDRFLKTLHNKNLKVTLNLHPCDGIRGLEDCYPDVAKAMGIDPATEKPVEFDASDEKFMDVYLKKVLLPLEKQGVDFWWIDWQQKGGVTKDGYDALWMLNHYLYNFDARNDKYSLVLSRYAGPGSHRYPVGFSGDTIMSWESLDFQPEFTATASNIGYGWWSHDIGGHKFGIWSDDLQLRWVQYGVFSPVYRPHSGKDVYYLKEPWNFPLETEKVISDFMRLRHALIPYIYTMNYINHNDGLPLCRPLYYEYNKDLELPIKFLNQYFFGSELMVCPITSPTDSVSGSGKVRAYLPEGDWFDFFDGRHYKGKRTINLYRKKESYPVLAKAGAIVPLANDGFVNGAPLPQNLKVLAFAGADGKFNLYEDNEKIRENQSAITPYTLTYGEKTTFKKLAVKGGFDGLPDNRNYTLCFVGFNKPGKVTVTKGGKTENVKFDYCDKQGKVFVEIKDVKNSEEITVEVYTDGKFFENDYKQECENRLARYQTENQIKGYLLKEIKSATSRAGLITSLYSSGAAPYIIGELEEIIGSGF